MDEEVTYTYEELFGKDGEQILCKKGMKEFGNE